MSAHPFDNDPGLPARAGRGIRSRLPVELTYPVWTHPTVLDHAEDWRTIRDCASGERAVKDRGTDYLPKLPEMDGTEYSEYLDRAVFFNMTGRTVGALIGIVFNRSPQVEGIPAKLAKAFKYPTRNNISFEAFVKNACRELITLGRYGVLLDMGEEARVDAVPYFVGFAAEHILDWQETVIDGKLVLTEVVLRELREERGAFGAGRKTITVIRRLVLVYNSAKSRFEYHQEVYEGDGTTVDVETTIPRRIIPTRNGVPLDRIPFSFMGSVDNTPQIDRSPVVDIASLNIAHYRSYAQLEHSRFFTAMPVFYAQVPIGNTERTYRIGSSIVWEVGPNEKPGVLEMNGHGLRGLETACTQKEDQISALGGRLMAGASRSTAESDNALKLKEGNERSILLNIVFAASEAFTNLLQQWVWWSGVDNVDKVEVSLNKEFLTDSLGARELRAVYAMYIDGVVPVTVLHFYLQKAEVVPEWMDADQFKNLLDDESEFKNQPDVIAKMKGYNTAKDRVDANLTRRELRISEKTVDQSATNAERQAELAREQMEKAAEEAEKQRQEDARQADLDRKAEEKKAEEAAKAAAENAKAAANRPQPNQPGQQAPNNRGRNNGR